MAKKFRFSLEPLLKLRAYHADVKKQALAEIIQLRDNKQKYIENRQVYLAQITLVRAADSTTAGAMQTAHEHRESVKQDIAGLEYEKQQLEEIERVKQLEYGEALKEVRILEKLREKYRQQYAAELNAEEQKFLDELALHSQESRV